MSSENIILKPAQDLTAAKDTETKEIIKQDRMEINRSGAAMTKAMLQEVFAVDEDQFRGWVRDQMETNTFRFMKDILPLYLKLFQQKEDSMEIDEKATVNIQFNNITRNDK